MSKRYTQRPGIGVDAAGGQVVDPTKNVADLVKAGEARHVELRNADQRFLDAQLKSLEKEQDFARAANYKLTTFAREAGEKLEAALRHAETDRINELAGTRKEYENTIRDMLAKSVETTSMLVSNQLLQIQATFNERVSKLEAFQFTQAGRSSVADPALSAALAEMATSIQGLTRSSTKTDTRREGLSSIGSMVVGTAVIISTALSAGALILTLTHH
jgi:hypothetical protein